MRTTLNIDADVLSAAKELAKRRKSTAGQVISDLALAVAHGARFVTFDMAVPVEAVIGATADHLVVL